MSTRRQTPEEREKRFREHTAKVMAEQYDEAAAELDAMDKLVGILHPLPDGSRKRVMRWVADRLDNFTPPIVSFP